MKALQHLPLHLQVYAAASACFPVRIGRRTPRASTPAGKGAAPERRSSGIAGGYGGRGQGSAEADRPNRRMLPGRPYPCPPRIQPAKGASRSTFWLRDVKANRPPSLTRTRSRLPSRSRERSAPSTGRVSDLSTDTRGAAQQINVAWAVGLLRRVKTRLEGHPLPFSAAYCSLIELAVRGSACDAPLIALAVPLLVSPAFACRGGSALISGEFKTGEKGWGEADAQFQVTGGEVVLCCRRAPRRHAGTQALSSVIRTPA